MVKFEDIFTTFRSDVCIQNLFISKILVRNHYNRNEVFKIDKDMQICCTFNNSKEKKFMVTTL